MGGLAAIGAVGLPPLLAACGGGDSTASSPTAGAASPTAAAPTVAAPTVAKPTAGTTAAATSAISGGPISVKAHEAGDAMVFDVDKLAVSAGKVTFNFSNTGKMEHELFVYPVQDIAAMLMLARKGQSAPEDKYIKGIAGKAEDIPAGKSATFDATLAAGFYELACFKKSKNPDGSTFVHFDKGQSVTVAAVGPGGPSASILTPSSTIAVDMMAGTGDLKDSWLFVPDHLMAKSGDVTFNITNKMQMNHDVVVYPLGDISALIKDRLAGGENYGMIKGQQLAEDLEPGKSISKTAKLTPGWWAAACFVVSKLPDGTPYVHRDKGQRFTFLVS